MKTNSNKRICAVHCEKSYFIPNTNIKVEEHNPLELEKLWNKLDTLNGLI